jgi:hypothetical protein
LLDAVAEDLISIGTDRQTVVRGHIDFTDMKGRSREVRDVEFIL